MIIIFIKILCFTFKKSLFIYSHCCCFFFDYRIVTRLRVPPNVDAILHAVKALDKTTKLEVKYINSFEGMLNAV